MKNRIIRPPSFGWAALTMVLVIAIIMFCLFTTLELVPALFFGCIVAAISAVMLGHNWEDIEKGIYAGIANGLGPIVILTIIGMVIGSWILGGTIPTLIYYGLLLLTPGNFLPVGFLLCIIVSVLIGSSFGTIATMGIVLMGIGQGLQIPPEVTAGIVVAGAMFGDKVSPLSDSTNLTAAMAGTDLFAHVRSMLYVSGPAVLISFVIYIFLGNRLAQSSTADLSVINQILSTLEANFNITIFTLIPPLIVLILSVMKVPAVLSLTFSFLAGAIVAALFQGASVADILNVSSVGFVSETGYEVVDRLLSQGGVSSMMGTIAIILVGTAMGGILEKSGILKSLLDTMMTKIKNPGQLILATLGATLLMLIATGEMMASIILPGRTFENAYREMKVKTNVLSRTLETGSTLPCGVLPWGVAAVYARGVLNVGFGYVKYTYLPFLAIIIAVIYALVGFATFMEDSPVEETKVDM